MKIAFFALNQNFCGTILEELNAHHTVKNYRPMGDKALNWTNIKGLIEWADLVYCDFVQTPCPEISQMQWMEKPFVARMDGIDILNHERIDWNRIDTLVLMPVQEKRLAKLRRDFHRDNPTKKLPKLPRILKRNIGIDLGIFTPDYAREPGYTIGFHAFVVRPTKRVYTMLQTFVEVVRKDPDKPWKLHFMGGGWDRGSYQWGRRHEYVMSLLEYLEDIDPIVGDRIQITAHNSPKKEWAEMARKLDIMWSTSYREGFPNSIGEAAACGVWPLMNHFYGAETIYSEENICLTPTEMVEKTIAWGNLSDEEKIAGRRSIRKHIEQYDRHGTARDIRELCEEVLERRVPASKHWVDPE